MTAHAHQLELDVDSPLDSAGREAVITRLQHQLGVIDAWFDAGERSRLIVHVEPGRFSPTTLLDFVRGLGVKARLHGADQGCG